MKNPVNKNNIVKIPQSKWVIEYDIPLPKRGGGQFYPISDLNKKQASFWEAADENTIESGKKMANRIYAWYRNKRLNKGEFENIFITGAPEVIKGQWGARIWRTND